MEMFAQNHQSVRQFVNQLRSLVLVGWMKMVVGSQTFVSNMKETTWETYVQFIAQEFAMKPRCCAKARGMKWAVRCQTCAIQEGQKPKEMMSGDFVQGFVQPCANLMTFYVKVKKIVTAV